MSQGNAGDPAELNAGVAAMRGAIDVQTQPKHVIKTHLQRASSKNGPPNGNSSNSACIDTFDNNKYACPAASSEIEEERRRFCIGAPAWHTLVHCPTCYRQVPVLELRTPKIPKCSRALSHNSLCSGLCTIFFGGAREIASKIASHWYINHPGRCKRIGKPRSTERC